MIWGAPLFFSICASLLLLTTSMKKHMSQKHYVLTKFFQRSQRIKWPTIVQSFYGLTLNKLQHKLCQLFVVQKNVLYNILIVLRNPLGGKCENSEIKKNTINIGFPRHNLYCTFFVCYLSLVIICKSEIIIPITFDFSSTTSLPPTLAAAKYHSLHVYFQMQEWKGNEFQPEEWEWENSEERVVPVHTDVPPAPDEILRIVICNCHTYCSSKRCTCRKHNVKCSPACSEADMCKYL